ncbi:MAG: hypothetical protein R2824_23450 [Saprospiraceae bacterium]|nr:hypothetical protein [Lewinella sp.]
MKNYSSMATVFLIGAFALLLNLFSVIFQEKWYPFTVILGVFLIVISFFIGKNAKPKRNPTQEEIDKLPVKVERLMMGKNQVLPVSSEFICDWTKIGFSGIPITYKDYIMSRWHHKDNIQGQICANCGKISHKSAKTSGLTFNAVNGFEKVKCNSCNDEEIKPIVIIQPLKTSNTIKN